MAIDDMSVEHMANWFECIRTRQQPIATVHDGFGHSVACMMAERVEESDGCGEHRTSS